MEKGLKIKMMIGAVLVCVLVCVLGIALKDKFTPSETMGSIENYYEVAEDEAVILIETEMYEQRALLREEGIYVSCEMVDRMFTENFYFDEEGGILSYALPDELIRVYVGDSFYYRNDTVCTMAAPIIIQQDDGYYMTLEFVSMFADMTYEFYENPNRIVIHNRFVDYLYYDAAMEAPVRFEPDIKSDIIRYVPKGEKLYYIGGTGIGGSSFYKVMLADGIYGYIQKKHLTESYYDARQSTHTEPEYVRNSIDGKVRLGWHVVTAQAANAGLEDRVKNAPGMNVISPTWYRITDVEGNASSLASADYVKRAHEMGLQVWALIDNFDKTVDIHEMLSSTKARDNLIDFMMEEAKIYGFDGWNLDFETLDSVTAPHFLQFIMELGIRCKQEGLIFSVDNYVPASYRTFYDLETQSKYADYIIIMAYDEHHGNSSTAGSVASLGFLQKAIIDSLELVPKEQLVMGVPFYTRLWTEEIKEDGTKKVTSESFTMNGGKNFLERNNLTAVWDQATRQNYAECTEGNKTYKIWLEDKTSMTERMLEISSADLAGIAAWRLGLETDEIWPLISDYIK